MVQGSKFFWALGLVALASASCSGNSSETRKKGDPSGAGGSEASGGVEASGGEDSAGSGAGNGTDSGGTDSGGMNSGGMNTGGTTTVDGPPPVGQVDLLFVIDNSVSMADKQQILVRAVPEVVERLVDPLCVSPEGGVALSESGECPNGFAREFAPLDDIHIGVITSSLGGHGSVTCSRTSLGFNNDDQAHLIPTKRASVPSSDDSGFLVWNGGDAAAVDQLVADFTSHVTAVGDVGCGFEAPLEAWYRFLVDPQPPEQIVLEAGRAVMAKDAMGNPLIDQVVLSQREAFLRPQSLVNIVVFTDENDCSVMDGGSYYNNAGFGYLIVDQSFSMPIATAECDSNPNDACCISCLQAQSPPEGCESSAVVCEGADPLLPEEDRANVRCYEQKRRFGVNLLYPTERYVSALRDDQIIDARTGDLVDNPLLTGVGENEGLLRPEDSVFFTGIIGVPWQDLVTQDSLDDPETFEYLTAEQLVEGFNLDDQEVTRWDVILGSPGLAMSDMRCNVDDPPAECGALPSPPLDPFMIESVEERPAGAENPISGDLIVASSSNDPLANAINGHEVDNQFVLPTDPDGSPANDDLQYACIFPLDVPRANCSADDFTCDCGDEPSRNRPLCQPPTGGAAGNTQYFAKAYPGVRILEVLRDFGENSVVSSICPKIPARGYSPTVSAMIERMRDRFPTMQ